MPLNELIKNIDILKSENGCPWDKKQNPSTLKPYILEELYELFEAIDENNSKDIAEEAGDVFFLILFILSFLKKEFSIDDVLRNVNHKMVSRHPHVFGESKIDSIKELFTQWDKIKKGEKKDTEKKSLMDSVPKNLPVLLRAYKLSTRAGRAGFDWDKTDDVIKKVEEELEELKEAITNKDNIEAKEEFGDLLFTMLNLGRFLEAHPEDSLNLATKKFEKRYRIMEENLLKDKKDMAKISKEELHKYWEIAKKL